jgi:hypothetical protein
MSLIFFYKINKQQQGKVKIDILDPIETKGLTVNDVSDLTNKTHNLMQLAFDNLNKDYNNNNNNNNEINDFKNK